MRVLMLHNHYQQPGGEDECFAAEAALLEQHGHTVERFVLHNDSIGELGMAATALRTVWNAEAHRALRALIRRARPEVLHAHNLFPLISPAALHAAAAERVPVVLTVHNHRLFCVNGLAFRAGAPCESCLGRALPWPGVLRRCYRDSALLSAGVATMLGVHRALGTWRRHVDRFVALTDFVRQKLVATGLPAERISIKPNFLAADPGPGPLPRAPFALFAGRLSREKGLTELLAAWRLLDAPLRLKIVGDGPLAGELAALAAADPRVELAGRRPLAEVQALMREATLVLAPSISPETFGRVAVEAFAAATPVVASRLGGLAEVVEDGVTGRLVPPGDPAALAAAVAALLADGAGWERIRQAGRADYERRFTAAANHRALMEIYALARDRARPGPSLLSARADAAGQPT